MQVKWILFFFQGSIPYSKCLPFKEIINSKDNTFKNKEEILEKFNVKVQKGYVADNIEDAVKCAQKIQKETGTGIFVIKAQIHAGGRGKGGGVKIAKSLEEVKKIASEILGMNLVTPQTPPEGKLVRKILIAEDVYYDGESERSEFYISVLLNRSSSKNMIIYSTEGGVDIETVAEKTPNLIFREEVESENGLLPFQARKIAFNLGLSGEAFKNNSYRRNLGSWEKTRKTSKCYWYSKCLWIDAVRYKLYSKTLQYSFG